MVLLSIIKLKMLPLYISAIIDLMYNNLLSLEGIIDGYLVFFR